MEIEQLVRTVGSCTCCTKTPEVKYHTEDCNYRRIYLDEGEKKMISLTHVVTFDSHVDFTSRTLDFCESNGLVLDPVTRVAENPLTKDTYHFIVILELEDAFQALGAIPVHNYIHMYLKPESISGELHNYLLSRLRRNF